MIKRWFLFVVFILCMSNFSSAQKLDSTITEKPHSVKLAAILSAALPGSGQIYNHIAMPKGKKKAFWKVPLIYAALGTTTYFMISNQSKVNLYKNEYLQRIDSGAISPGLAQYDNNAILTLHDQSQNNRDLMILATAGVYIINILDAAVEAHFVNFDISEDLTMHVRPTMMMGFSPTPGLSLRFNFR